MLSRIKSLFFSDAGFLFASTIIVNAGNYAINLLLGRFLGPEQFAEASILATSVLILSFVAVGFQLTTAKYTASFHADQETSKTNALYALFSKRAYHIGIFLTGLIIIFSQSLRAFLNFESAWPLIIIALSIPLYFHLSVSRGLLQGEQIFRKLAYTYIIEMIVRLFFTIILVYFAITHLGMYSSEAISIAFLLSFVCTYFFSKQTRLQSKKLLDQSEMATILKFVGVIGIYELSQILINNSDIILVKHFFENIEAGQYAAIALIGRVVFFATWTVVTLLFPKVIEMEKKGEDHSKLFWSSLSIVALVGIGILMACLFFDELIITILFGDAYVSVSPLLWQYALATTLFASANVFAYYHMSLNNYLPVGISIIAGIVQIILISIFHDSLITVIQMQILVMTVLLLCMISYHFLSVGFARPKQNLAPVLVKKEYKSSTSIH